MSQVAPSYAVLPVEVSAGLETLYQAVRSADDAFAAIAARVQGNGKAQRLAPGVWVITQPAAPAPPEREP